MLRVGGGQNHRAVLRGGHETTKQREESARVQCRDPEIGGTPLDPQGRLSVAWAECAHCVRHALEKHLMWVGQRAGVEREIERTCVCVGEKIMHRENGESEQSRE